VKVFSRKILVLLIFVLLSQCEKDEPKPNDNWVIGAKWIDIRDGQSYPTIPIGNQIWLAENMAYLPSVNSIEAGSEDEGNAGDPFYYVYGYSGNDTSAAKAISYYRQYGVLYNWTAAKSACPEGWHLPSESEWMELEMSLGISSDEASSEGFHGTDEGSLLKATWGWDFDTWKDRYGNGTNQTGFTALPGGSRYQTYSDSVMDYLIDGSGHYGLWWSSTESSEAMAWCRILFYSPDKILKAQTEVHEANSVRCIKN
jgi:uncharacterized protein (TIGR02145 family)